MTTLFHTLAVLALPPLLVGVIGRVKAVFAGRIGAPVLQPYFDLSRLVRKDLVISRTTSWVFRVGPVVGLVAVLAASLLVPIGGPAPLSFSGDFVLFAYLLGLARFFTVLAALAEPALFLGLLAGVRLTGSSSLSTVLGGLPPLWTAAGAPLVLVALGLFVVLLVENSRIPFDDPNTHLELTMVHEVMVLDHSGPLLALILTTRLKAITQVVGYLTLENGIFVMGIVIDHIHREFSTVDTDTLTTLRD